MSSSSTTAELLETLGDFTSKENWDKFFTIRGGNDAFEWYAEWPDVRDPLLSHLQSLPPPLQVLVPGCGSSRLSEHLYDAGFRGITNVDFSKVAVSAMLRRNVRDRPEMRWRVMDMTDMQFSDEFFDAVVDKGGLDALMEPKHGPKLGRKYLKEVKRVLKPGGKLLCLTLAESHVVGLLFSEFRFGWKTNVYAISQKHNKDHGFQTFMVVTSKDKFGLLEPICSLFDHSSTDLHMDQGTSLTLAIKSENETRSHISSNADMMYSLEDLCLGAKGDLKKLFPGRRCQVLLGEEGESCFSYRSVLLDAKQQSDVFSYQCGVFIVPKIRAHEWLFTSTEGQWLIVDSSKAGRLIMVFLDSRHTSATMDDIQKDLSPLVKPLLPEKCSDKSAVPFLMAGDGVKQRNTVKKVTSAVTGTILVEDVIYENNDDETIPKSVVPAIFRRLSFERNPGLVQSEGLLVKVEQPTANSFGANKRKSSTSSKHGKKGNQKRNVSLGSNLKLDHSYLASSYHRGILSGFVLISSSLRDISSSGRMAKTLIIGLGAGLFPMCLHQCLPFLDIEVVELDPVVFNVAKDCFEFNEDRQLKVHIADGIKFIEERNPTRSFDIPIAAVKKELPREHIPQSNDIDSEHVAICKKNAGANILIIDVDSSDTSSGLTCPPAVFLEESFLFSVKNFLSEGGLLVLNLVSRSTTIKEKVVSRMKMVFEHLFYLELEEDVNVVVFALQTEEVADLDDIEAMAAELEHLLTSVQPEKKHNIRKTAKKIRYLK